MAHPHFHAKSSARRFGGVPEDYYAIHNWIDQSKAHLADPRHRSLLHSTFGIFLAEQHFGLAEENRRLRAALHRVPRWLRRLLRLEVPDVRPTVITRPSDGQAVPIRVIAERHVLEDLGHIPNVTRWFETFTPAAWMNRNVEPLT